MTRAEILQTAKPILFNTEMIGAILDGRKTQTRRVVKYYSNTPTRYGREKLYKMVEKLNDKPFYGAGFYKDSDVFVHEGQTLTDAIYFKSRYKPGDYLYVREAWAEVEGCYGVLFIIYKADGNQYADDDHKFTGWCPSIHMPKEAARIFLKVTGVRAERLQDISEEDAKKEGIARIFDYLSEDDYNDWQNRLIAHNPELHTETQEEQPYCNYLWHGHYGSFGMGNKTSDSWDYQYSGYEYANGSFSSLWNSLLLLKDWDKYGWDANPWVWVYKFERMNIDG